MDGVKTLDKGLFETNVVTMKYFIFVAAFFLDIVSTGTGLATVIKPDSSRTTS